MKKITQLITSWPKGTVSLTSYLNKAGYGNDLLKKYVNGNWLESLGYGAYKLAKDMLGWEGAVYAMQSQGDSLIHPGAKTALELKGFAHYFNEPGSKKADLFGSSKEKLPKWFSSQDFNQEVRFITTSLFDYSNEQAFTIVDVKSIPLRISSPELAILEMLYLVPQLYTFDEAYLIMEGLTTLRSNLLQNLLEKCRSVKVKRLFLYMAERNDHQWFIDLDIKKIDLGKGKRALAENGRLNSKYIITVPKEYEE